MLDDYRDSAVFVELIAKLKEKEFELEGLRKFQGSLRKRSANDRLALSILFAGQSRRTLQPGLCRKCMVTVTEASSRQEKARMDDPSAILMSDYVAALSAALMTPFDSRIRLILNIEPGLALDEDRAQWIGLIFAEAATNSLKHAFPGLAGGLIAADMGCDRRRLRLTVSDNGSGFGTGGDGEFQEGGFAFMKSVALRLAGDITFSSSHSGTVVRLTCPILPGNGYD